MAFYALNVVRMRRMPMKGNLLPSTVTGKINAGPIPKPSRFFLSQPKLRRNTHLQRRTNTGQHESILKVAESHLTLLQDQALSIMPRQEKDVVAV